MKTSQLIFILLIAFPFFTTAQENGGFEEWGDTGPTWYPDEMVINNIPDAAWGVPTKWKGVDYYGVARTSDAYSGAYSLILHNWYNYANQSISHKQAIQNIPNAISGYYKYIADENEGIYPVGLGQVIITNSLEDTISLTNFTLDTTSVYQYFEFDLDQTTNATPDSIEITFTNVEYGFGCTGLTLNVCNFLYLDDIQLSFTIGNTPIDLSSELIKLYPNPSSEYIHLDTDENEFHIKVYDMKGELLLTDKNNKRLNVKEFSTGLYFVKIYDGDFEVVGTNRFMKK